MQMISADLFDYQGNNYLVIIDRYSSWPVVIKINRPNASELCSHFRTYFMTYGVPQELVTDGGRQFECHEFEMFLNRWNVSHHITSSYNPHSNLLAESGAKSMKRLIRDNTDNRGNLDTDALSQALLTYRNTPLRGSQLSPSLILFGRKLRDNVPGLPGSFELRKEWQSMMDKREEALARKHVVARKVGQGGQNLCRHWLLGNMFWFRIRGGNTAKNGNCQEQ